MRISVILCTYNRSQSLARTLESVAEQILPNSIEWEVLVVDNNSKDQTRDVVEDFCRRYSGRFRYLFEPRQGLSHARNAGIREARGDVLAFTDDDVILEATWLRNLTSTLQDGVWVGAGGRILPEQTFVPPRWLSVNERHALAPLAIFDGGPAPINLPILRSVRAWLLRRNCLINMVSFEPTWVGARKGCLATRTPSMGSGCLMRASGYVTKHQLSSTTPSPRIECRRNISWLGGSAKDERTFGNGGCRLTPSGTSQGFHSFSFGD